jgi:drug/metabolite transporter (DMT)-like permease
MSSIILAIGASIFKTFSTLSEKQVLVRTEPAAFTASASLIIAFISLPLLYFVDYSHIGSYALTMTVLCAVFSTISAFSSAYVLKHLDISESATLFALSPIVITFLAVVFLGEQLATIQFVGIGISCIGIFILEGHRHSAKQEAHITPLGSNPSHIEIPLKHSRKSVLYIALLVSLICFSSSAVLDRYIVHHLGIDPLLFLIIVQFFILLCFLIIDIFNRRGGAVESFDIQILKKRSFWAHIFFVIIHRIFHMFAVQGMGASLLHAIKQSSVVFTTILGGKLFVEKHMIRRTIACVCVVLGVVLAII